MSKRITSLMVFVAAVLLALPTQAQTNEAKKNAKVVNGQFTAKKALDTKDFKASLQKAADVKAKADSKTAEPGLAFKSVSALKTATPAPKSSQAEQSVPFKGVNLELGVLKAKEPRVATANRAPRKVVQGDPTSIIKSVPSTATVKKYARSGYGHSYNSTSRTYSTVAQSGTIRIAFDGNDVYLQDVLSTNSFGSWVKGTLSGNTITVPLGQFVYYDGEQYGLYITLADVTSSFEGTNDLDATEVTFTINGDEISLNGTSATRVLTVAWNDDNSVYQYGAPGGDYESVYTYDSDVEPASTDLVELPAGATVEAWNATGTSSGTVPTTMNVAFVGNEVYVSNLNANFPNSWIKGTLAGNKVTFSGFQYLGDYYASYQIWAVGATLSGALKDDFTMTYDADEETLTLDPDQLLVLNAAEDKLYYLQYYDALTLSKAEPVPEVVELPYSNGFNNTDEQSHFTIIDANNDGSTWSFDIANAARYHYSQANAGDDWLVSPRVSLKAGKKYHFSIDTKAQNATYPERFEVKAATENTAEALAAGVEVIPSTDVNYALLRTSETEEFTVAESGEYYIGVHAISDKDMYYLTADNFLIEAAPATAPYSVDFTSSADTMDDFIVLNNNDDDRTWIWSKDNGAYYRYSSTNTGDDYLILPIKLEAGKNYDVELTAASSNSFPEKFEVVYGTAPTADALTNVIISETEIKTSADTEYSGTFNVTADGVYYVAIHAVSDPDEFYLKVKNLSILVGADNKAPAAVTDFAAVAGENGALEVNVSFTAPTTTVEGIAGDGTISVDIYRDGVVVTTLENVAYGSAQTWKDTNVENAKTYTYQAITKNGKGDGLKSDKVDVYVGLDTPADLEDLTATDNVTTVGFAWPEVGEVGQNGGYVDPTKVDYQLWSLAVDSDNKLQYDTQLATVTGSGSYDLTYNTDEGEQDYAYWAVRPTNTVGNGGPAVASLLVGAPYALPVIEGFADNSFHYIWEPTENAGLFISEEATDDDGVALALAALDDPGTVTINTGKVNLNNAVNPTLLFDVKSETITSLNVVGSKDGAELANVATANVTSEYTTVKVPLTSLAGGRYAQIGISADFANATTQEIDWNTFSLYYEYGDLLNIDNIRIVDLYEYDLSATVSAPEKVDAGKTATVTATVENLGENEANGYTIIIKAGDEELLNQTVNEALAPFKKAQYTAEFAPTIFSEDEDVIITAEVQFDNDLEPANNTDQATISVKASTALQAENVTGVDNDGTVTLTWDAPEIPATQEVTEDFEEGFGNFVSIDADGDGYEWLHHINTGDGYDLGTTSGDGSVYSQSYDNSAGALNPDNWLVVPAILDGTFKFWAEGQDPGYADEHFAVYVSTESGTDVSTFTKVSDEYVATADFTEYSVDLTGFGGASGWVAIRHFNVSDMFYLVIDDVTYLESSAAIAGYNIYVDGELVGSTTDTSFDISDAESGEHEYSVSVVYSDGSESTPVTVTVDVATFIKSIVEAGKTFDVYTVDGIQVRKNVTNVDGLKKGVYVINGVKVLVK